MDAWSYFIDFAMPGISCAAGYGLYRSVKEYRRLHGLLATRFMLGIAFNLTLWTTPLAVGALLGIKNATTWHIYHVPSTLTEGIYASMLILNFVYAVYLTAVTDRLPHDIYFIGFSSYALIGMAIFVGPEALFEVGEETGARIYRAVR